MCYAYGEKVSFDWIINPFLSHSFNSKRLEQYKTRSTEQKMLHLILRHDTYYTKSFDVSLKDFCLVFTEFSWLVNGMLIAVRKKIQNLGNWKNNLFLDKSTILRNLT